MNWKDVLPYIADYESKDTESIRTELAEIISSWKYCGLSNLSRETGVKRPTLYQIMKPIDVSPYRPSFEIYARIISYGKNPLVKN